MSETNESARPGAIEMQFARLWFTGLIGLTLTSATLTHAAPLRRESKSGSHHFVEFRARYSSVVGHTYVVYGKIDDRGRILKARAAGFYPRGVFSESVFAALLPLPGYVGSEPADHSHEPSAIYRRRLNASEYARLVNTVESLRKTQPVWDLLFFNCNAFTAEAARSIGLRVPSTLELPNDFVRDIYSMNRPTGATFILNGTHHPRRVHR